MVHPATILNAVSFFACIGLILHAFLAPIYDNGKASEPVLPWWSLLFRAVIEFCAICLWLPSTVVLLGSRFIFGDRAEQVFFLFALLSFVGSIVVALLAVNASVKKQWKLDAYAPFSVIHLAAPLALLASWAIIPMLRDLRLG